MEPRPLRGPAASCTCTSRVSVSPMSALARAMAFSADIWALLASSRACLTVSAVVFTPSPWCLALLASSSSRSALRTSSLVRSRMASTLERLRTRSLISSARCRIWIGEAGMESSSTRLATASMLSGSAPSSVGQEEAGISFSGPCDKTKRVTEPATPGLTGQEVPDLLDQVSQVVVGAFHLVLGGRGFVQGGLGFPLGLLRLAFCLGNLRQKVRNKRLEFQVCETPKIIN